MSSVSRPESRLPSFVSRPLRCLEWLPGALAGVAFAGFAVVFGWEVCSYQKAVVDWANRDLQSRADLAAANLEEPLRTQDFRKIHAFGDDCVAEGVRLTIAGRGGGRVFDTQRDPHAGGPFYRRESTSGEYTVTVSLPAARVLAPFYRALVGFGLAGLVGMAGVLLFFFVTYRQRVRIRELGRLEKFRRDFIADVSHEIKTPLTGILGAVDLMGEKNLSPETLSKLVGMVKGSSLRLHALVQGILSLARLEREGDVLNLAETDLGELVRETVESLKPQADLKGIRLACEVSASRIRRIDAQLLAQALTNLIVNAIRHSGSKEVVVSLEDAGGRVQVAVEDHGVGIPAEHRARIFERFYRSDASRTAETGGAGLGLAIVRQIARLHGGDVTFEPVEPTGARFVIALQAG